MFNETMNSPIQKTVYKYYTPMNKDITSVMSDHCSKPSPSPAAKKALMKEFELKLKKAKAD